MAAKVNARILVIGLGWGGIYSALSAARALDGDNKNIEVAVIAPEPLMLMRVRLYESDISTVKPSVKELLDVVGVRYIQGYVRHIHTDRHEVEYSSSEAKELTIQYDRLILASGSEMGRPNVPGLDRTFNVDNYRDARALDEHLRSLPLQPPSTARDTVIVVGAGFTGIETATELPTRLRQIFGAGNTIPRVIVFESASEVGRDLGPGPRAVIQAALDNLKVAVYTGERVTSIEGDKLTTSSGRVFQSQTIIWTGGMCASGLTRQITGARLDQFGRCYVEPTLKVQGVQDVFATGDVACAMADDLGHSTKLSCQHAINMGKFSGHNAAQDLLGLPQMKYEQPFYTVCLDLGEEGAVVTTGWERTVWLQGAEGKAVKKFINTQVVYPPPADRTEAFKIANPALQAKFTMVDGNYILEYVE